MSGTDDLLDKIDERDATIATLTAQLAEARAMAEAVIERAAQLVSDYPQSTLMLPEQQRICEYMAEVIKRALDPDASAALAEYVRPLQDEVTRLREGLRFYKDAWKFKTNKRLGGLEWSPTEELLDDCGNKARALLEGDKP